MTATVVTLQGFAPRIPKPTIRQPEIDPDQLYDGDTELVIAELRQRAAILRGRMSKEDFEAIRSEL
jgi:hypothetical protein